MSASGGKRTFGQKRSEAAPSARSGAEVSHKRIVAASAMLADRALHADRIGADRNVRRIGTGTRLLAISAMAEGNKRRLSGSLIRSLSRRDIPTNVSFHATLLFLPGRRIARCAHDRKVESGPPRRSCFRSKGTTGQLTWLAHRPSRSLPFTRLPFVPPVRASRPEALP